MMAVLFSRFSDTWQVEGEKKCPVSCCGNVSPFDHMYSSRSHEGINLSLLCIVEKKKKKDKQALGIIDFQQECLFYPFLF